MRGRNQPTSQDAADFAARLNLALDQAPDAAKVPVGHGRRSWLSRTMRVSRTTAGGWLNGDYLPIPDRVRELSQLCGVRHDWLYFGAGPMRDVEAPINADASAVRTPDSEALNNRGRPNVTSENLSQAVTSESLIVSLHLALTSLVQHGYELPDHALIVRIVEVAAELLDHGMPQEQVVLMMEAMWRAR